MCYYRKIEDNKMIRQIAILTAFVIAGFTGMLMLKALRD